METWRDAAPQHGDGCVHSLPKRNGNAGENNTKAMTPLVHSLPKRNGNTFKVRLMTGGNGFTAYLKGMETTNPLLNGRRHGMFTAYLKGMETFLFAIFRQNKKGFTAYLKGMET